MNGWQIIAVNDSPIQYDITLMSYLDLKTMPGNTLLCKLTALLCASVVAIGENSSSIRAEFVNCALNTKQKQQIQSCGKQEEPATVSLCEQGVRNTISYSSLVTQLLAKFVKGSATFLKGLILTPKKKSVLVGTWPNFTPNFIEMRPIVFEVSC